VSGNVRAGGQRNPAYTDTFVFNNDFAALQPETSRAQVDLEEKGIVVAQIESGICRVVCFSPRHDLTLSRMPASEIRSLVDVWVEEFQSLGQQSGIKYVQIFENRGLMMGCSNPHPHGQIWATSTVPNEPRKEQESFLAYQEQHGACLLCDYIKLEASGERLVYANDHFIALVPFWAIWPYEVLVVSKRHLGSMSTLTDEAQLAQADILKCVSSRYDNLFQTSCPYSMDSISNQPTTKSTTNGISTHTFIRLCCDRPASGNLWLDSKCWVRRNATSRPNMRPSACGRLRLKLQNNFYGCAGAASDADAVAFPTENRFGCGRYPLRGGCDTSSGARR